MELKIIMLDEDSLRKAKLHVLPQIPNLDSIYVKFRCDGIGLKEQERSREERKINTYSLIYGARFNSIHTWHEKQLREGES